jgi:hypothetical protein
MVSGRKRVNMMDTLKINEGVRGILTYFNTTNLKIDEKIAVLRASAFLLEAIVSAEATTAMMSNLYNKSLK